jgi:mannan endo-1,6-alpha-mannosidase
MRFLPLATACLLAGQGTNAALTADLSSSTGIKATAKSLAADLMSFYTGNNPGDVAGNLPAPYYWWEAGAM